MKFTELDIPEELQRGITEANFETLTPVQAGAIPVALEGKDVAAQAQTGTGKTAAFLVPILTRLATVERPAKSTGVRALILAPTRELVVQIQNEVEKLGKHLNVTSLPVFGGTGYQQQMDALKGTVDIVVATPGRLIDYLKQKVIRLSKVEVVVVDEADRMFDLGFIRDLRFILRRLPPYAERQTLLLSATLSHKVMELAYEFTDNPEKIMIEPEQVTAERVEQLLFHVSRREKMALLFGLLKKEAQFKKVLHFVNTKIEGERLERDLEANGYKVGLLSGDVPQKKRMRILEQFKEGTIGHLVATDVASRGIHIDAVDLVVNYDLPQDAEDYVHRIGRTARAGSFGHAISLADEELVHHLPEIEAYIGAKIPSCVPGDDDFLWDFKRAPRPKRQPSRDTKGKRSGDNKSNRRRPPRKDGPKKEASGDKVPPKSTAGDTSGDNPKEAQKHRRRRPRRRNNAAKGGQGEQSGNSPKDGSPKSDGSKE